MKFELTDDQKIKNSELVNEYLEWPDRKKHIESGKKTSNVVRKLIQKIIRRGNLTVDDVNTIYLTTIWSGKIGTKRKIERIEDLYFSRNDIKEITDLIDDDVGRWGTGIMDLSRYLDTNDILLKIEHFLTKIIKEHDKDIILKLWKEFSDYRLKGFQMGIMSNILYCIHPNIFPIINYGMKENFDELTNIWLDGRAKDYHQERKTLEEFRDHYGFDKDFIDLDVFLAIFINTFYNSSTPPSVSPTETYIPIVENIDLTEQDSITAEDELEFVYGEPMELGVMRWTPTNEAGVVAIFVEFRNELNFPMFEFIRTQYPDACVYEKRKKGGQTYHVRKFIEFELNSRSFKNHVENPDHIIRKCDYVVCWNHDWPECPIPVIELKTEIKKLLQHRKLQQLKSNK